MNRINPNRKLPLYTLHMVLLLFVFLPLIFAFTSSFRPMEDIYRYVSPLSWKTFIPEHFTLEAYQTIFVEHGFGKALLNSLLIALLTVAVGILFNGMAGYAFAKFTFPGKKLLFLLVLLSYMMTCYSGPQTVDDMIRHLIGKVLDRLGIPADYRRWGG